MHRVLVCACVKTLHIQVTGVADVPGLAHSKGDPLRGQSQVGSLTGAVHLSKGNAGVLRAAQ
jgi:hypothetical protein